MKNITIILLAVTASVLMTACGGGGSSSSDTPINSSVINTKNIILFIGDGMGSEHRKSAQWISVGITGRLAMDAVSSNGFIQTYSANGQVTDSAAAATAMATGTKTDNGIIGLDVNLNRLTSILENAKTLEKSTGLITTTQMTHATPAAFAAHIEHRSLVLDIAEQMANKKIDVLLGGGENDFLPILENGCFPKPGKRDDNRNLVNELTNSGYTYVCDNTSFQAITNNTTSKLIGLFADEGMTRPFSPSLAEMTQKAISLLSKNPKGFFLMIESGQIDWASHENDASNAISDTLSLDDAVKVAKEYASASNDTLIIITADHETGGMTVSDVSTGSADEDGPYNMPDGTKFYVNWDTTGHTGTNVPIGAYPAIFELFDGIHDNTYIYDLMSNEWLSN